MTQIRNLDKLAQRIIKAIQKGERMVLYADSDLDGTAALIILKEAILRLGGAPPVIFFSDRRTEEPGLIRSNLERFQNQAPALLVLIDCGISNFAEVKLAKKMGFEVALLEHHEILNKLPEAALIVDPKQEKKKTPSFDLAAVGLSFKLAERLLRDHFPRELRESFLELAALATISDMVPQTGENQPIIDEGLPLLETSLRPAIRVLFASSLVRNCQSTREIVQKVIPIINVTEKEGDLGELYLFLSASAQEAKERLDKFFQRGSDRQREIDKWLGFFQGQLFLQKEKIIFVGHADLPSAVLGAITSRLWNFFEKPTFLFKRTAKEDIGHFRTPVGLSGIKALGSCKNLLRRYGGHAMAGGFYFNSKDEESLKKCLTEFFNDKRSGLKS